MVLEMVKSKDSINILSISSYSYKKFTILNVNRVLARYVIDNINNRSIMLSFSTLSLPKVAVIYCSRMWLVSLLYSEHTA